MYVDTRRLSMMLDTSSGGIVTTGAGADEFIVEKKRWRCSGRLPFARLKYMPLVWRINASLMLPYASTVAIS